MQEPIKAYLTTALWSSSDVNGKPLDNRCNISNISECTVQQAFLDIRSFLELCDALSVAWDEETDIHRLMHDFWLTRNHHGAGFWDGDYPIWGYKLTEVAHMFPEVELYVGDDGFIYHM